LARAQQAEGAAAPSGAGTATSGEATVDLQATIDTLRAEVAQVRVALQQYRQNHGQS
jgi:uncharacterized protein YceH (UPF0502 family)